MDLLLGHTPKNNAQDIGIGKFVLVNGAKDLGKEIKHFDQGVWDEYKYGIVVSGNHHKFSQHPALKQFLLSTGDRIIVEASPVDAIWGIGMAENDPGIENLESGKFIGICFDGSAGSIERDKQRIETHKA